MTPKQVAGAALEEYEKALKAQGRAAYSLSYWESEVARLRPIVKTLCSPVQNMVAGDREDEAQ